MLNQKEMFIAVYRFTVISGKEATFEAAWLKRTQGITLWQGERAIDLKSLCASLSPLAN